MLRLRAHFLCPRARFVVRGQHRLARGSQGYVVWILGQFGVHGALMPGGPPLPPAHSSQGHMAPAGVLVQVPRAWPTANLTPTTGPSAPSTRRLSQVLLRGAPA